MHGCLHHQYIQNQFAGSYCIISQISDFKNYITINFLEILFYFYIFSFCRPTLCSWILLIMQKKRRKMVYVAYCKTNETRGFLVQSMHTRGDLVIAVRAHVGLLEL